MTEFSFTKVYFYGCTENQVGQERLMFIVLLKETYPFKNLSSQYFCLQPVSPLRRRS